jgi:hypothetical protein
MPTTAPAGSTGPTGATDAVKSQAYTEGLAFVDHFYPVGGPSLSYTGPVTNPHLTKPQ